MLESTERRFVLWALDALDLPLDGDEASGYRLHIPPADRSEFEGVETVRLVFDDDVPLDEVLPTEAAGVGTRFFSWLMGRLQGAATTHAAPASQPSSVHELSAQLFEAYRIDGGTVRLGGCTLEDRPLLRISLLVDGHGEPARVVHEFHLPTGETLEEALESSLGLDELIVHRTPPRKLSEEKIQHWMAVSGGEFQTDIGEHESDRPPRVAACVVWAKFAAGKLEFSIGPTTAEVTFADWARRFATEEVLPPPFRCPHSGIESYHIAATDDGRISVAEAIQTCEATGKRVLRNELSLCEATQRQVVSDLLETCPVQGKHVLGSLMENCTMCGQRVGPDALRDGRCQACRELAPVRKSDPRMARLLDEYPKLDRWHHWRIAETSSVYILSAATFFKRLLVVLEKESLQPLRLARRGRFSKHWQSLPPPNVPSTWAEPSTRGPASAA